MVELEVLLLRGCVHSPHGPDGSSSTYKKSLREIADFKEPKSAPAGESAKCGPQFSSRKKRQYSVMGGAR